MALTRQQLYTGVLAVLLTILRATSTHSWIVAHGGMPCMIMVFNATIQADVKEFNDTIIIPSDADDAGSICEQDHSIFHLEFDVDLKREVGMLFVFNKTESYWSMTEVMLELYDGTSSISNEVTMSDDDFEIHVGHYLQCSSDLEIPDLGFTFTSITVMQPFATGTDPGKEHPCNPDYDSSMNIGLIVGCVIAGMVICVCLCFFYTRISNRRRRRRRGNRYPSAKYSVH